MKAAALALLIPAAAAAQIGSVGYTTEGGITGRVCDDLDGDGACSSDEPGLAGANVVLETGLTAVTDAAGRFHFAALEARRADALAGGRLVQGRHRVKLDVRELFPGTTVAPPAATVELAMGAVETVNFAVRRPVSASEGAKPAAERPPLGELAADGVRLQLTGKVAGRSAVTVAGAPAEVDADGVWSAWVTLADGGHDVPLVVRGADGRAELFVQRVEVVRRQSGVLVVPLPPRPLGAIAIPPAIASGAVVAIEAPPGTKVTVEGRSAVVGPSGRVSVQAKSATPSAIPVTWEAPGEPAVSATLAVESSTAPLLVGLLDVEATLDVGRLSNGFRLFGRGAGTARARLFGFADLEAELDFRDTDVEGVRTAGPGTLIGPRAVDVFERQTDWLRTPLGFGDDAAIAASNDAQGRVRVQVSRDGLGHVGYGTTRAWLGNAELGRFHRGVFGGYLDLKSPDGKLVQVRAKGFAAPTEGDPSSGLARRAAHERFEATGGSLFYLSNFGLVQGSELVRVEISDGVTGLPLEERHLLRGRDYTIDYLSGRILLTRPLSFAMGHAGVLGFTPPTGGGAAVLWVDYEHVVVGGSRTATLGGELSGKVGPVTLGAGGAVEPGLGYSLLSARASTTLGPVSLAAEVARSSGVAEGLGASDDGGLTPFARPVPIAARDGWGVTARLHTPGLFGEGSLDAAVRRRTEGFSDASHFDPVLFQQLSLRFAQPFGPVFVAGLLDERIGADPRTPYAVATSNVRTLGGAAGWESKRWGVRLEARDAQVGVTEGLGGRTSVGLSGRVKITDWLTVIAAHRQRVVERGTGPGRWDDTFASVGVDVTPTEAIAIGARGGWGPVLGPQVWGQAQWQDGDVTHYGGHAFDADAPSVGEARTVAGARQQVGDAAAIFVEDVAAHDATALKLSRAVGLTQELAPGFSVTARYERGLRRPLDDAPTVARDAGGLTAQFVRARGRAFGRAEVRADGPTVQWVAAGGGEARLFDQVSGVARFQFSHTRTGARLTARLFEGTVSVAWRPSWGSLVARYTLQRELGPPSQGGFAERSLDLVSLMPSVRLGSRFTLGAGAHLALSGAATAPKTALLSVSLRPAVRIIGGLEVAAEVARRSQADDGQLTALRGEVGWRFDDRFLVAGGVTVLGFSGLGLNDGAADSRNRVYLRAEAAY